MEIKVWAGESKAILTTEHSASSYGQPVLVIDEVAYGFGDEHPKTGDYLLVREYDMPSVATDRNVIAWNQSVIRANPTQHEEALRQCAALGIDPYEKLRQYVG